MESAGLTPPTSGSYDNLTLDSCFHVLRLYCARDYSMERTLNPTTSTPFHLDFRTRYIHMHVHQASNEHSYLTVCVLQLASMEHSTFSLLYTSSYYSSLSTTSKLFCSARVCGSLALGYICSPSS